jgi:hypothetical protein
MDLADSAMRSPTAPVRLRAVPILKNVRLFVEANVLYEVLDILPKLDREQALNLAAWAVQSRSTLFANLRAGMYEMALAQLHAALGPFDESLHTRRVDTQAARAALGRFAMLFSVAPLFKGAVLVGTTEAAKLIFECWKTLTGVDDLACHTLLLQSAQFNLAVEVNASISGARQMVEEAREALKQSLKVSNANLANALELHHALLDFIDNLVWDGPLPEWAMTTLAEMASDPVSLKLCEVNPNAAAWPFWLRAQRSLENLSSEGCLALLSQCTALQGVVPDGRLDVLFAQGIRQLVNTHRDLDGRYPLALRAFMIWQSVSPANVARQERLPLDLVETLVASLHRAIDKRRPFTGVDSQRAMAALMDQLLQENVDAAVALNHLDAVLDSKVIQQDHPLLGVLLCAQCADYFVFVRYKQTARVQELVVKALAHLPADTQQAQEALELLKPFRVI